ncbi:MAG: LysR substrate-binding domain-containing protein [Paracoccaceae bacterium]
MSEPKVTIRQIETFRAVMVSSSMTEAARLLSVTQPAVSKIIAQLELEIGFPLFHRGKGQLRPTDDAYTLYCEVEKSFSGLDRVARAAKRIRHRASGSLRLAVLPTFSSGFVHRVVRSLYAQGDDIQLSIQNYNSDESVDFVASGICDLGFVMTPVDATRVQVGPVMAVPSFCLLPPGHRLSEKEVISISDLAGEDFIATSEGTSSRLRTDALFDSMNVARNLRIEARWAMTISNLVREGLGCAILDAFAASSFAQQGGTVKPLTERVDFTFVCITPRVGAASNLTKRFMAVFETELSTFQESCAELGRTPSDLLP